LKKKASKAEEPKIADIEEEPKKAPEPIKKRVPHGSAFTHDILRKKKIQIAAQYLRGPQGKGQWIIALLLMIGIAAAAGLVGGQVYQLVHPPLQVVGVCPPPAFLQGGNCVILQPRIITISGVATATEVTIQAGTEYLANGTLIGG
jgi:hypothetical protein